MEDFLAVPAESGRSSTRVHNLSSLQLEAFAMCSRFPGLAGCLLAMVLGNAASATEPQPKPSSIWLSICQTSSRDSQSLDFEIQVPSGIDFKVVDTIAESLSDRNIKIKRLVTRERIEMKFSSNSFLVMKIDGNVLTLAPGSGFPFDATRTLATRLSSIGLEKTMIVEPGELLQRRFKHGDPFFPEFAYDLRDKSGSQSRSLPGRSVGLDQ